MSLVGTWNLSSSENWDEYLKELGVGLVTRKASSALKPTVVIERPGSEWVIKVLSTLKSQEIRGVEGVAFEESTMDGRTVNTTFTSAGANRLVQTQVDKKTGAVSSVITRELAGDELVQTLVAGPVTCTRRYKRSA